MSVLSTEWPLLQEQVLEMLVESGADLDARTPQGETPLCKYTADG